MLVIQLPSDLKQENNSISQVKSAMLKEKNRKVTQVYTFALSLTEDMHVLSNHKHRC